jgi:hypothetical protein
VNWLAIVCLDWPIAKEWKIGLSEALVLTISGQRTFGPLDLWAKGPTAQRIFGPRNLGSAEESTDGLSSQRPPGARRIPIKRVAKRREGSLVGEM